MKYELDGGLIVIAKIYDGAVHPVARHCGRTILTQSISIATTNAMKNDDRNLYKSNNILSAISSNGKENTETLDKVFKDHFAEKKRMSRLEETFGSNEVDQIELHGVKFMRAIFSRNRNISRFPFLGCYCQRGDSFNDNHTCQIMKDEEYVFHYQNAKKEWEEELMLNPNARIEHHKHWCSANDFGVNNFVIDPKHLPLSKIRCNFGLHVPCAIARNIFH